jgi:predicted DCC family thiol-disulfide oxidoreductase YuxK
MTPNIMDKAVTAWMRFWFQEQATTPLEIIRIGIAAILFINYGLFSAEEILELYGDAGMLSKASLAPYIQDPWLQSLLYYISEPWHTLVFYSLFLFSCLMLMLGWHAGVFKWIVFFCHLSFAYRNPAATYGVDGITISILLILCLAPIGKTFSLDRVRKLRKAKYHELARQIPLPKSRWGFACTRLIQIQMVILFFFSAAEKLYGDAWWYGNAVWMAITNYQTAFVPVGFLAENYWLINLATYGTILLEFAYVFLIWGRKTRPYLLLGTIGLHLSFAFFLGLYFFAAAMILGHLSFVRHRWLHDWRVAWKARMGEMEMIYDGHCGFCKRSMAWLLAFDGLGQIAIRDYRSNPSPVVSSDKVDKALYVVYGNNSALPGFNAYRYVVLRVPGLWWLVPLFHIPFVSAWVGRPIYHWVASNRDKLSAFILKFSKKNASQSEKTPARC